MAQTNKDWKKRFDESVNKITSISNTPLNLTKDITEKDLLYLGGFVEGEGSMNINIRSSPNTRFGFFVDPEFGLYQNNRNTQHLFTLCRYLKAGTVYVGVLKREGLDPLIPQNYEKASYRVGSRKDLLEKVIPFIKKYVLPYAGAYFQKRFELWSKAIDLFEKQVHLSAVGMYREMIPLVISLRVIQPRFDASVKLFSEEAARGYLMNKLKDKLKENTISIEGLSDLDICKLFDQKFPQQGKGRTKVSKSSLRRLLINQ
jgi:hypothetical protein